MQLNNTKIIYSAVFLVSILLSACGGGGGGGSSSGNSSPQASVLSGVAAVGTPIVNGNINVVCAAGSALPNATTTNSITGAYSVTLSGQTLPCAVKVSGGTINGTTNTAPYQSIAISAGTVNVTPLTDLIVANLTGTATPGTWFAGLSTKPAPLATITQNQVNTALVNLSAALSALTPLSTNNPITTAFTPSPGNVSDNMLTALKMALANTTTGVTYASLLSNASAPAFAAPVIGFGTDLTTAYNEATRYSAVMGGCVYDISTGLMWEVKTTDGGLRDWNHTYTNYDNTASLQLFDGTNYFPPTQAQIDASSNSIGFKNNVNATNLCSHNDWRLPTQSELSSIVLGSYPGPTIDSTWFPNTQANYYWSSSPDVTNSLNAGVVFFIYGSAVNGSRYGGNFVRLVRTGL